MRNIFIVLCFFIITTNACIAQSIVLSDILREAREAQIRQAAAEKIEETVKPVKKEPLIYNSEQKIKEQPAIQEYSANIEQ